MRLRVTDTQRDSVMTNSSEAHRYSDFKLNGEECYTNHGGVVISLGWDTPLYQYITKNIPDALEVLVNVADILDPPKKEDRIKGAIFPDKDVVKQVRDHRNFEEAKECCERKLDRWHIVLVCCKGGNHRAPTVADSLKRPGRFIIHATLGRRQHNIPPRYIEVLVHACVESRNTANFYRQLTQDLEANKYTTQLCVGWQSGDPATCEWDTSNEFPEAGVDVIEVRGVRGYYCDVKVRNSERIFTIPVTWLLPTMLYKRREDCNRGGAHQE